MSLQSYQWTRRPRKRASPQKSVLIVDDYATGAEALAAAFRAEDYDVNFALSGIAALEILSNWHPDIIILDINMPEYNGYDTARIIRLHTATRETPLVAFTALSAVDVIDKAKAAGFDAYYQKGIALCGLFHFVNQMLD